MKKTVDGLKTTRPGSCFSGACVLRAKTFRYTRHGKAYLILELGDASGRARARVWQVSERERQLPVGAVLQVRGIMQQMNGARELELKEWQLSDPGTAETLRQLVPGSDRPLAELQRQFEWHVSKIRDPYLSLLLGRLLQAPQQETFFQIPAGKLWHHNYIGGLLEHCIAMLDMVDCLQNHHPAIHTELLKCGIICHDIEKPACLKNQGFVDYSDAGRLLGVRALSYERVEREIRKIEGFPEGLRLELLHLILSCPCPGESSVSLPEPQTVESIILNHLVMLNAYANAMCRIVSDDTLPGERWTRYVHLLNRSLFAGGSRQPQND